MSTAPRSPRDRTAVIAYSALAVFAVIILTGAATFGIVAKHYIARQSAAVRFETSPEQAQALTAVMVLRLPDTNVACGDMWQANVPSTGWPGLVAALAANPIINPGKRTAGQISESASVGPNSEKWRYDQLIQGDTVLIIPACPSADPDVDISVDKPLASYDEIVMAVRLPQTGASCDHIWYAVVPSGGLTQLIDAVSKRADINPDQLSPDALSRGLFIEAARLGYTFVADLKPGDAVQLNPLCNVSAP